MLIEHEIIFDIKSRKRHQNDSIYCETSGRGWEMYVFLYRYVFEKWLTDMNGKYRINVEKFVEVMAV